MTTVEKIHNLESGCLCTVVAKSEGFRYQLAHCDPIIQTVSDERCFRCHVLT